MLVTSCLIPILVLLFFAWLVKLMLGIEPPPLRVKLGDGKAHSASGRTADMTTCHHKKYTIT